MLDSTRAKRWLVLGFAVAALGLAACGDDDDDDADSADSTAASEEIVIETDLQIPTGDVVDGSSIGDEPFCPDGTFRDSEGSGRWFIEKAFDCPDGTLTIGFSPSEPIGGVQRGPWEILSGTESYEGLQGGGRMEVTFESQSSEKGNETFTGTLVP